MNDKKTDPKEEDDLDLFRKSVADARPLKQKNIVHHHQQSPKPSTQIKQRKHNEAQTSEEMLSDEYYAEEVETGDELLFSRPGLQHSVIKKLRRGQFNTSAELDLHGMVVTEARQALLEFIHECRTHNVRYVRIVHGKGYGSSSKRPVLKNRLNNWLRQIDDVLAFCSAQPKDGGTGAVYLLLKRDSRRQAATTFDFS